MPIYEYRCATCKTLFDALRSSADGTDTARCKCGGTAERVMSRPSVHLSKASKLERLDPKYDKMVDRAMRNTPESDPDRHLKRMKPFTKD